VDPSTPARLDPALRTHVNGQLYWVASREELTALRARPFAYTGRLRDPVTGSWFEPSASSPRRERAGEILLFSSERSASEFDAS
jgi:YHS domain-containing protein